MPWFWWSKIQIAVMNYLCILEKVSFHNDLQCEKYLSFTPFSDDWLHWFNWNNINSFHCSSRLKNKLSLDIWNINYELSFDSECYVVFKNVITHKMNNLKIISVWVQQVITNCKLPTLVASPLFYFCYNLAAF